MEFSILRPNELNQSSSGPRYNPIHIIRSPFNNSLNTNAKNAILARPNLNSFNLYTGRYSSDGEVLPVDHQLLAAMLDPQHPQPDETHHYLSGAGGAGRRPMSSSAALMWKPVDRRGLTAMDLNSDELARNEYLLRVRRLGFDYLKPAGVGRTMQAVLEDEAEEEEEEEDDGAFEIDEDIGGARFAQDEGLTEDGEPIPPEGEEEEEEEEEQEEEEEEEVDLDDAVEEASEFDYDDDDEDDEDQAGEEEDPFMVDEEYDEFTTITRTATTTSNATRPPPPGLQVPEPRTLHLQPQQHRRHPRTSEISEQHFSDIYESDSHRSAAAIAEDLEPASSSIGVLGRYRRASPEVSITEHSNNNYYDSRRPVEDENDGESEMEVD